jgi:hypothetical protein
MNANPCHPDRNPFCDCDNELIVPRKLHPASHSFLEPRGEGIVFAIICLLASAAIYAGALLIRALA